MKSSSGISRWLVSSFLLVGAACSRGSGGDEMAFASDQGNAAASTSPTADGVQVPAGFAIEVWASNLPSVRTIRSGPDGMLYVALSERGRIVRLDPNAQQPSPVTIAEGLNQPYGLAFHGGDLYVGENDQVVRLQGPDFKQKTVIIPDLPGSGHWTREIVFGADSMLYLSVGSSCNLCEEDDPRRAAISRYAPDGSGGTVIASGLRNSAGLAVNPANGQIWASQNERDNLGDDVPPEEVNVLSDGTHFGWPYCYGQRLPNPEYKSWGRCGTTTPPALEMQAHSAPLGVAFYTGTQFPEAWRGDFFVAFHGSWNRRQPTGYLLAHVDVKDGRPVSYEPFASGWLTPGGDVTGRPVYPSVGPDGSLYVSDDLGGRIYRIRWVGP